MLGPAVSAMITDKACQLGHESLALRNRVALVTGSSTGLGKAIAFALGQAGARVAINYAKNTGRAEAAFAEYQALGAEGMLVQADVTDPVEIRRLLDTIRETMGPVEILVANATCDQPHKPIEEPSAPSARSPSCTRRTPRTSPAPPSTSGSARPRRPVVTTPFVVPVAACRPGWPGRRLLVRERSSHGMTGIDH